MAKQVEQRVFDVQHVRVLAVKDSGVHQKKFFAGLGFESRLLHDFDGLTCSTGTIFIVEIEHGGSLFLRWWVLIPANLLAVGLDAANLVYIRITCSCRLDGTLSHSGYSTLE